MEDTNSIKGEDGAIVDDPIPLELSDFNLSVDFQPMRDTPNYGQIFQEFRKDEPTGDFTKPKGEIVFENSYFFNDFDNENSLEGIIGNAPCEDKEKIQEINQQNILNETQYRSTIQNNAKLPKKTKKTRGQKTENETKNIPKNYAKQIIKFIKTHRRIVRPILQANNTTYQQIMDDLLPRKQCFNKISDLRYLWLDHKNCKALRIITEHFLRKYCYKWIFNSKIEKYNQPLKYRKRMFEAVRNPTQFYYIKKFK